MKLEGEWCGSWWSLITRKHLLYTPSLLLSTRASYKFLVWQLWWGNDLIYPHTMQGWAVLAAVGPSYLGLNNVLDVDFNVCNLPFRSFGTFPIYFILYYVSTYCIFGEASLTKFLDINCQPCPSLDLVVCSLVNPHNACDSLQCHFLPHIHR